MMVLSAEHLNMMGLFAEHLNILVPSAEHLNILVPSAEHLNIIVLSAEHPNILVASAEHLNMMKLSAGHLNIMVLSAEHLNITYLHVMELSNNPICRKCATEEETSVHVLCECEALTSLRYTYQGSFFLVPDDIRVLVMGAIWNFAKGTGFYSLVENMGHKGPVLKVYVHRTRKGSNPNNILFYSYRTPCNSSRYYTYHLH
jgi:hypothetical protein